ncbi:MAG: class I SAM-dependent methyltransferase [Oceanicaulis sp.]|nr:class I SAM-dependent methyltransferase [Oceanicaulis sp.]
MIAWPGSSLKPRRTAFRRAKKEHLWTEPWVVWRSDGYRDLVCPACRTRSVMNKLIDASPPFEPRKRYALYRCDACGSLHYPDAEPIAYEAQRDADLSRKYYLEIGAGLDSMLAPLAWLKHADATAYLEVGGGYGFSVDFAARALGWRARGMDPSSSAAVGARDLGYELTRGYLSASEAAPGAPFDCVLSSEVIEHVRDPDPFLAAMVSAASDDGVLMLTTPDAAAVSADLSDIALLQIVVAGHHIVIFTAEGLRAALKRAGLTHIEITSRDQTLLAVAARRPVEADFDARPPRDLFRGYLRARRDDLADDPALYAGFAVRLLKECIHTGEFDAATEAQEALTLRWRREYAIDLDNPSQLHPVFETGWRKTRRAVRRYAREYPLNLAVALFYTGRLREEQGRRDEAEASYRACARVGRSAGLVFKELAAPCRETEDCVRRATMHAAMLTAARRPEQACADLLGLIPETTVLPADLWREAVLRVFSDGVLAGAHGAVAPLDIYVHAFLNETAGAPGETEGLALGALGMRALQQGAPEEAERRFAAARDAMTDPDQQAAFERLRITAAQEAETVRIDRDAAALIGAMQAGDAAAGAGPARRLSLAGHSHHAVSQSCAFAMGLWMLNARGQGDAAAAWFARAAELACDRAEASVAREHEMMALKLAGQSLDKGGGEKSPGS